MAIIVVSSYIGAQMLADIASLKIGVVAGLAVDMGTFIYPITFTLRDVAHKILGQAQHPGADHHGRGHQPLSWPAI